MFVEFDNTHQDQMLNDLLGEEDDDVENSPTIE